MAAQGNAPCQGTTPRNLWVASSGSRMKSMLRELPQGALTAFAWFAVQGSATNRRATESPFARNRTKYTPAASPSRAMSETCSPAENDERAIKDRTRRPCRSSRSRVTDAAPGSVNRIDPRARSGSSETGTSAMRVAQWPADRSETARRHHCGAGRQDRAHLTTTIRMEGLERSGHSVHCGHAVARLRGHKCAPRARHCSRATVRDSHVGINRLRAGRNDEPGEGKRYEQRANQRAHQGSVNTPPGNLRLGWERSRGNQAHCNATGVPPCTSLCLATQASHGIPDLGGRGRRQENRSASASPLHYP